MKLGSVKQAAVGQVRRIPNFGLAMILAVVLSLVVTIISLEIYVLSGTSSLDASLPGYEQARKNIHAPVKDTVTFESEGTLNEQAYKQFFTVYDQRTKELSGNNIGTFSDESLSNVGLGLMDE